MRVKAVAVIGALVALWAVSTASANPPNPYGHTYGCMIVHGTVITTIAHTPTANVGIFTAADQNDVVFNSRVC